MKLRVFNLLNLETDKKFEIKTKVINNCFCLIQKQNKNLIFYSILPYSINIYTRFRCHVIKRPINKNNK